MRTILWATLLLTASCTTGIRKEIPQAGWEPSCFKKIDSTVAGAGMQKLREKKLARSDLEVRVWAGFGRIGLAGLVVQREAGSWRAYHVQQRGESREVQPSRSWKEVWNDLVALGILSLPDSSALPKGRAIRDGISYVVEYQTKGRYRTYEYGNPGQQPWPEAEAMSRIAMLLVKEFSLPRGLQGPNAFSSSVKQGQVVLVRKGKAYGAYRILDIEGWSPSTARISWVYRTDGGSLLSGDGVVSGESVFDDFPHEFGPFWLLWSRRDFLPGSGRLSVSQACIYYPDPAGKLLGNPQRQFIAISDRTSFADLDGADAKWRYKASFVDPLPAK